MLCSVAKPHHMLPCVLFLPVFGACIQDPCTELCKQTAEELDQCIQEWPISWRELGYSSQLEFSNLCSTLWSVERSTLEPRSLDDAYEQCEEAYDFYDANTQTCDQLRALYILPAEY